MADKHEFTDYADTLRAEIARTAASVAQELPFAKPGGDADRVTRPQLLDHIRFNWAATPGFPQTLLDRYAPKDAGGNRPEKGLQAYLKDVGEAFPWGSPPPQMPPAAAGGGFVSGMNGGTGPGMAVSTHVANAPVVGIQAPGPGVQSFGMQGMNLAPQPQQTGGV